MSKPKVIPSLYRVRLGLADIGSSLHMPPDPVENPGPDDIFLDELDKNVLHAKDHLQAVYQSLDKLCIEWPKRLERTLKEIEDLLPLTSEQKRLLFHEIYCALNNTEEPQC